MFPHTVTLYLELLTRGPDGAESVRNHITVLRGVLLAATEGTGVRSGLRRGADAATLYIPFDVRAEDGETGAARRYVPPEVFAAAEDKAALWTLMPDAYFVAGAVVDPAATLETMGAARAAYPVTRVTARGCGSPALRHWKVRGPVTWPD